MIWPFSRRSPDRTATGSKSNSLELEFGDLMVSIRDLNFFGRFSKSPNGEYVLVWRDADPAGGRGGYRESGKGDYLLIHGGYIAAEGKLERPNDGKVSDSGRFVLSDWCFGDALRSTFYVFDNQGRILISHQFRANALHSEISTDGCFAIFMTARSDNSDSNKLWLFDIESAEVLLSKWPESGIPDRYDFDSSEALLWLVYDGKGRYAFSMSDGTFLDQDRWETERIDWAHPFELSRIGQERLKAAGTDIDLKTGAEIAFILKKAIASGINENAFEHARTLKTLGDLWERLGDHQEALKCFEEAQSINPKVGVKRRIARVGRNIDRIS